MKLCHAGAVYGHGERTGFGRIIPESLVTDERPLESSWGWEASQASRARTCVLAFGYLLLFVLNGLFNLVEALYFTTISLTQLASIFSNPRLRPSLLSLFR